MAIILPMRRLFAALLIVVVSCLGVNAQAPFIPLGHYTYHTIDRLDIKYGRQLEPNMNTGVKPYSRKRAALFAESVVANNFTGNPRFSYDVLTIMRDNNEWLEDTVIVSPRAVWNVFYKDPATLYGVNTPSFILKINPVLQFQLGDQVGLKNVKYINTRGVEVRGSIKKRLSFYTLLTDNQYHIADYVMKRIDRESAVPGQLYYKDFKTTGVDYFNARGYIVFNVLDHIDIQFGHDKNFWGDGYRSLILSDYGGSYFFLKLQTTIWRICYTNLFTEMTATYNRSTDKLLPKKYGAFHHLNINITNWLDLGLFEAVIYKRDRGFELQYLNPIIFYRAVEQALGSPDNALVGADYKVNLFSHVQLYGQIVFDEFNFSHIKARDGWWANKFAIQTGAKYIDAFGLQNLDLQAEFNYVRPFMYTHNTTGTTYTHYNQAIAHPLGANFWEMIAIARYQVIPGLRVTLTSIFYKKGLDGLNENWGGNIFLSTVDANGALATQQEFGNHTTQGITQRVTLIDLLVSYELRHNLIFDLDIIYRNSKTALASQNSRYMYLGFGVRLNAPWYPHHY